MYENMTFEKIVKRMLDSVEDSVDKREGSIIYDAIAPCAVELQLMYIELDTILKETFGDTASREYLIKRAVERGIVPYSSSHAILKGEFNIDVPIGSRFNQGELNYVVVEKIEDNIYKLKCETIGTVGNKNFGELIPIEYLLGLSSASITELLIPAEDEESTESIRKRYFNSFDVKAYGGNVADYVEKTNNIAGVGSTKVTPVWNGGGTVKLTILDSEYNKASSTLVETVQNIIDPVNNSTGAGVAPIGHTVTVVSAEEVVINVTAKITFVTGYEISEDITNVIDEYLLELRKSWGSTDNVYVRIAQIETRIMNIDGVVDIENTMINGKSSNVVLGKHEIPVLGGVTNG